MSAGNDSLCRLEVRSATLGDGVRIDAAFDEFVTEQRENALADEDWACIAVPVDATRLAGVVI